MCVRVFVFVFVCVCVCVCVCVHKTTAVFSHEVGQRAGVHNTSYGELACAKH